MYSLSNTGGLRGEMWFAMYEFFHPLFPSIMFTFGTNVHPAVLGPCAAASFRFICSIASRYMRSVTIKATSDMGFGVHTGLSVSVLRDSDHFVLFPFGQAKID
jgi:hypothetical protein